MSEIDDETIGLVVTSPPYFNAKDYGGDLAYEFSHEHYGDYKRFLFNVFKECHRTMIEGRFCIINTSNIITMTSKYRADNMRLPIAFDTHNIMAEIGFEFVDDIFWVKPAGAAINRQANFFQTRKPLSYRPNQLTEYILVYRKNDDRKRTGVFFDGITEEVMEKSKVTGEYEQTNVWHINPETSSKHPAPFPYSLPYKCIKYYSFVGDTILDPFMGSGTTAYVAQDLGREFIGYELNKEYIQNSNKRTDNMFI